MFQLIFISLSPFQSGCVETSLKYLAGFPTTIVPSFKGAYPVTDMVSFSGLELSSSLHFSGLLNSVYSSGNIDECLKQIEDGDMYGYINTLDSAGQNERILSDLQATLRKVDSLLISKNEKRGFLKRLLGMNNELDRQQGTYNKGNGM